MDEDAIFQYLKKNLRLDCDTRSEYVGHDDSGRMYRDYAVIKLMLGDECLSEVST